MLTPLDIHNKEFKRSFRGYNEDEIDEFLDRVVKDYEQLYRENVDLKDSIDKLKTKVEHFQHLENTLHNTLVVAQETAEEVKLNAKKEAELIIKEAKVTGQRLLDEANLKVKEKMTEYEEINQRSQLYRTRMRTLVLTQLELLKDSDEAEEE
ncbi:DivIVA domain-containing protein [Anaerosinus gibii]|uniref:DivIVA domain-containing protein n=1 Tax=Selenobaculum gibii TaxID=3054208 RepID=A0A9Y2AKH1_9FIRM|nr:DivIVA domain-containing protein [Selenobaculum gbiensis]WIW71816.1 DivIVA domain-containing protein [Selenobaculum gbiensis]